MQKKQRSFTFLFLLLSLIESPITARNSVDHIKDISAHVFNEIKTRYDKLENFTGKHWAVLRGDEGSPEEISEMRKLIGNVAAGVVLTGTGTIFLARKLFLRRPIEDKGKQEVDYTNENALIKMINSSEMGNISDFLQKNNTMISEATIDAIVTKFSDKEKGAASTLFNKFFKLAENKKLHFAVKANDKRLWGFFKDKAVIPTERKNCTTFFEWGGIENDMSIGVVQVNNESNKNDVREINCIIAYKNGEITIVESRSGIATLDNHLVGKKCCVGTCLFIQ